MKGSFLVTLLVFQGIESLAILTAPLGILNLVSSTAVCVILPLLLPNLSLLHLGNWSWDGHGLFCLYGVDYNTVYGRQFRPDLGEWFVTTPEDMWQNYLQYQTNTQMTVNWMGTSYNFKLIRYEVSGLYY